MKDIKFRQKMVYEAFPYSKYIDLSFKLRGLENTILARVLFLFQERT